KERQPVNYVYFGILFLFLSVLHVYHVFLIENATGLHRFFYTIYALGQCLIEVLILMAIGHFFSRISKTLSIVFIMATFLLFLTHLIDFPLVRIMGMSFWYALDMMLAESLGNFIELLYATHTPIIYWVLAGLASVLIPVLGIVFFRSTHKISQKKPIHFSKSVMGMTLFTAVLFLSIFDVKISKVAAPDQAVHFLEALPWKTTFFPPAPSQLEIGQLSHKPSENDCLSYLKTVNLKGAKKPNIFLFVAESLREDFLTPEVAPALSSFRESNIAFPQAFAAANATQQSWFSIFHSVYPFYWEKRQPENWTSGSLPLQVLKKAGYQVHVYSASRLQFYHMDERLFGKDTSLADTLRVFGLDEERENHENDSECMATLIEDLSTYEEGNVFIVFLESTHFGYSWPQHESLVQAPDLDYLSLTCSNDQIEGVKNRYRNAIHFIDGLFGQFLKKLESVPGGEEAVVVFTGDHGEEFFEQQHVFHASNLSSMQIHVPLYFRLGTASANPSREMSSHLDIFPTILDHVLGHRHFASWFDGESILRPSKKNFAVATRYNGSRSPFEFLIHTGKEHFIARFNQQDAIFKSRALEIVSHRDEEDQLIDVHLDQIKHNFKLPLEMLFKH
ncbi:MAG TPA: sulfatase-like hydrolase/transferase, partial [Rhabdochlamydiaceae bacterium]